MRKFIALIGLAVVWTAAGCDAEDAESTRPAAASSESSGSGDDENGESGEVAAEEPGTADGPEALLDRSFTLREVESEDAAIAELWQGADATLTFSAGGSDVASGEDGTVGVYVGCNHMSAAVKFDGDTLEAEPPFGTLMACSGDGVMERETWIGEFLAADPSWGLEGETLVLTGPSAVLRFS